MFGGFGFVSRFWGEMVLNCPTTSAFARILLFGKPRKATGSQPYGNMVFSEKAKRALAARSSGKVLGGGGNQTARKGFQPELVRVESF